MTNREKINSMCNEELAATIMAKVSTMPRFSSISGFTDGGKEIADWLSQETEDKKCGNCKNVGKYVNVCFHIRRLCSKSLSTVDDNDDACDKFEAKETINENYMKEISRQVEEHTELEDDEFTQALIKENDKTKTSLSKDVKIEELEKRLDKLEECDNCRGLNQGFTDCKQCTMDVETKEKTADEMFKDLRYEQVEDDNSSLTRVITYQQTRNPIQIRIATLVGECIFEKVCDNGFAPYITEDELEAIYKKIKELKNEWGKH